MAMKIKFPDFPSCSAHTQNQWRAIWKLAVPEKEKIFLWRAAHDLLPTAENLWKKKVLQEPTCQICCCSMESISHALLDFKMARKIWKNSQLTADFQGEHIHDMVRLLQSLPQWLTNIDGASVAALLWVI